MEKSKKHKDVDMVKVKEKIIKINEEQKNPNFDERPQNTDKKSLKKVEK